MNETSTTIESNNVVMEIAVMMPNGVDIDREATLKLFEEALDKVIAAQIKEHSTLGADDATTIDPITAYKEGFRKLREIHSLEANSGGKRRGIKGKLHEDIAKTLVSGHVKESKMDLTFGKKRVSIPNAESVNVDLTLYNANKELVFALDITDYIDLTKVRRYCHTARNIVRAHPNAQYLMVAACDALSTKENKKELGKSAEARFTSEMDQEKLDDADKNRVHYFTLFDQDRNDKKEFWFFELQDTQIEEGISSFKNLLEKVIK
jgi:hypothetical protein